MKRNIQILFFALCAIVTFSSCSKDNMDGPSGDAQVPENRFEISLVAPSVKTANEGLSTVWVDGDKVNVFHAEAGTMDFINDGAFEFSTKDRFTGVLAQELEEGKTYDWYVSYPYDITMESPKYMRIHVPAVQSQLADMDMSHLCGDLCPLAGKVTSVPASQNPNVMMSHLVTVMKIKVTNYESEPCNLETVSFCHHTNDATPAKTVLTGVYFVDITGDTMVYKRTEEIDADDFVIPDWEDNSELTKSSIFEGDPTRPYIRLKYPKTLGLNQSATVYLACIPFTITNGTLLCIGMNNTTGGISQAIYGKNPVLRAGVINGVKQGSRLAPPFKSSVNFYHGKKNADGTYTIDNDGWWRCDLPEGFDLQGSFDFKKLFTTTNSDAQFTFIDSPNQNAAVQEKYDLFKSCLDESQGGGMWNGRADLDVDLSFPEYDRSGIFVNSSAGYNVGSWAIMYREAEKVEEETGGEVDAASDMYNSYQGLVMAGYQGWHGTPGDGCPHNPAEGWPHYASVAQQPFIFEPGAMRNNIDFWPDVTEYEKTYPAEGFICPDGSTPHLYSSYDASTVNLHFKWMKDYGIDGVFMQRFVSQLTDYTALQHSNKVLSSAMSASNEHARAISIMYDMVGMGSSTPSSTILNDASNLMSQYNLMDRSAGQRYYLYHNGKPLVGLVSVGQKTAPYTVAQAQEVVDGLQALGFSVLLGVPAYWRSANGEGDVVNDPNLIALIKDVDIIMPWLVGVYDYDGTVPTTPLGSFSNFFNKRLVDDFYQADAYGVEFCPLVFPGFSDRNINPMHSVYERYSGDFYWQQIYTFINKGAKMLYVAMFDEIDEGTAIYKCLRKNEVPSNEAATEFYIVSQNGKLTRSDVPVEVSGSDWCRKASELNITFNGIENDLESDYYLKLTGHAGKILKKEAGLTEAKPF